MLKRGNASMMVGASSWKDQFLDAFTVQAGNNIYWILISSDSWKYIFQNMYLCFEITFLYSIGDDEEEEEEGGEEGDAAECGVGR